jgi:hypothetical protein
MEHYAGIDVSLELSSVLRCVLPGFERGGVTPVVEHFENAQFASFRRRELAAVFNERDAGFLRRLDEQGPLYRVQVMDVGLCCDAQRSLCCDKMLSVS